MGLWWVLKAGLCKFKVRIFHDAMQNKLLHELNAGQFMIIYMIQLSTGTGYACMQALRYCFIFYCTCRILVHS